MSRPLWLVQLIKKTFPQRFVAARMTHLPLLGKLVERWLFKGDDLIYLPRDQVILVNQPLALPEQIVLPSQVAEHFIKRAEVHWIMDVCICRDASRCQDYPIDLGCLFLGRAALDINPRLGRRVTQAEALAHARRCREAGLVHLLGRNKLDTVWLGVGPGERLLTICNCCPCCCLWRMLPQVNPQLSAKVARMPGVTVQVSARCTGCGACSEDVCFVDAIQMVQGRAVIGDACRGCGRCIDVCPQNAIEITLEDGKYVTHAIERLSALVDVS